MRGCCVGILVIALLYPACTMAGQATIAVATNFKRPTEHLVEQFHQRHPDHTLQLVSGATGKLYTQIVQGAPFDIFLAADDERPARLEAEALSVAGSRRTYALGQLALLGNSPVAADALSRPDLRILAMANPRLAPYGKAAQQTMRHMNIDLPDTVKVVYGENVGQAYALVATGNAELGFVARSMLTEGDASNAWLVPAHYHEPIRQQSVLLRRAAANEAALAFTAFLAGQEAAQAIQSFGYLIEPS